jgi:ankyrin repeat protein
MKRIYYNIFLILFFPALLFSQDSRPQPKGYRPVPKTHRPYYVKPYKIPSDLYAKERLLYLSIKQNRLDYARFLLKKGVDVNAIIYYGNTPLISCIKYNSDINFIKYLIKKGADLNKKNVQGDTPLIISIKYKTDINIIKYFIKKGADTNRKNKKGHSPLHIFVNVNGDIKLLDYLIDNGADLNSKDKYGQTPLHYAAKRKSDEIDIRIVKRLIAGGAKINSRDLCNYTPLLMAAISDNMPVAKMLVKNSAEIDIFKGIVFYKQSSIFPTGKSHCRPPRFTYKHAHLNVIRYLLEMKAFNVNIKMYLKRTFLHEASIEGDLSLVKYLLSRGADVNARDEYNNTPLHYSKPKVVRYLVDKGAEINAINKFRNTPVFHICRSGDVSNLKMLYKKGMDLKIKTVERKTTLHFAARNGRLQVVQFLIEKGVDVNAKDKYGFTPLHETIFTICRDFKECKKCYEYTNSGCKNLISDSISTIEYLIARKANVNAKTTTDIKRYSIGRSRMSLIPAGSTPLRAAKISRMKKIVDVLIKHGAKE